MVAGGNSVALKKEVGIILKFKENEELYLFDFTGALYFKCSN